MLRLYCKFEESYRRSILHSLCVSFQHPVAKKLRRPLHDALHVVIKEVNHVKVNSLKDRLFREVCNQNGDDFLAPCTTYRGEMDIKKELPSMF